MKTDEIRKKLKTSLENGSFTKFLLLIVVAAISFFPFFSIQMKLRRALEGQPKLLMGSYISIVGMVFMLILLIIISRPKK